MLRHDLYRIPRIKLLFALAILFVIILLSCSIWAVRKTNERNAHTFRMIELGTRQRMNSQRLGMSSFRFLLAEGPLQRKLGKELALLADSTEQGHQALLMEMGNEASRGFSPQETALLYQPPMMLDQELHSLIALVKKIAADTSLSPAEVRYYNEAIIQSCRLNLDGYQALVSLLMGEHEKVLRGQSQTNLLLTGAGILLVAFMGIFIFLPLIRKTLRSIDRLKHNEQYFQSLLQNSSDIITILDRQGIIQYQSEAFKRILGHEPGEAVGKNAFDYVHPDDAPRVGEVLQKGVEDPGFRMKTQYRFRHRDGSWRFVESIGQNLLADPVIQGIVINTRDVTDRRKAREDMMFKHRELNTFIYKATHDLKAPLASALGLLYIAREEKDQANVPGYLNLVHQSILKLDKIVTALVEITQISDEEPAIQPIQLRDLVADILKEFKGMIREKNMVVETDIALHREFYSDKKILSTVLRNLLLNAIIHRQESVEPSLIKVSLQEQERLLQLSIADNGMGFSSLEKERIFEMFYKASTRSSGNGLGLYLVQAGLEKLGGKIEVESEETKGSVFTIYLPNYTFPDNYKS